MGIRSAERNTDNSVHLLLYGVTFNPKEVANNMKKLTAALSRNKTGRATEDYLSKVMSRITIVGSHILSCHSYAAYDRKRHEAL